MSNQTPESPFDPERVRRLNDRPPGDGAYVLLWMQQSQRAEWSHALEYAVWRSNETRKPLLALFALTDRFPEANLRHFAFMIEGVADAAAGLEKRGIKMVMGTGDPPEVVLETAKNASEVVCDMGYLRIQRQWRRRLARRCPCALTQVESDAIVPVETVSDKAEYAARTIRPKISRLLDHFLKPVRKIPVRFPSLSLETPAALIPLTDIPTPRALLKNLDIDASIPPADPFFTGGFSQAKKRFNAFLKNRITRHSPNSNQPQTNDTSGMGPYLHFGHVSALWMAWRVKRAKLPEAVKGDFLEQLIVRRELSINFVWRAPDYDSFSCLPPWARKTLIEHAWDPRPFLYSRDELDAAQTHDPYWNAAMDEMKTTGYMHNYMRMYWGKKILEWTKDPETAFDTVLWLNNRYFLDGRDPNSFAGAAWIFGKHDRAWKEREIFGKVRYMNAAGLERKCDIKAYVAKVGRFKKKAARF
jgi:deoxyribodipyrimidine photo-lyase